jgi:Leucine-rich repeat (LRR) protein
MKLWSFLKNSFATLTILLSISFSSEAQILKPEELAAKKVYTSLEDALKNPTDVYRLKLIGKPKCDSLPDEFFTLVNLQELTVRKCKLQLLNKRISQLKNLQYLNLDQNRLVKLPESLCNLSELKTLIISRNIISYLPDNIGKLTKLESIDAWDNQIYVLPKSIAKLSETLQVIDLRQVAIKAGEYDDMLLLLPKTKIYYTSFCECENPR